jgi:hypothetical protein
MLFIDSQADTADLPLIVAESYRQPEPVRLTNEGKEVARILFGIGMCNSQRGGGNFAGADQRQEFGDVGLGVRAQD